MPTFSPGKCPNPKGRPKGTGHRQQLFNSLVLPKGQEILNKALSLALDGNEAMLKVLLDRLLPSKPIDEPINLNLQNALPTNSEELAKLAQSIIAKVAVGELTPSEGKELSSVIQNYQQLLSSTEFSNRLAELEKKVGMVRSNRVIS